MTTTRNNRKRAVLGCVLGALVLSSAPWAFAAEAPPLPGMTVQMGSESFQVQDSFWNYDATKDTFSLNRPWTATAGNGSTFRINSAEAVPDPLLFFSGGATNNTNAPLSYSIAFNSPLLPNLLGPVNSHAELGLTLTDGLNDGATVQPTVPGGKMLMSVDLYSNGTPISKNVNIGDLFSILSGTGTTTFSADNSLVCSQACVTMSAIMSFTLTGQDAVGFSGKVVQVAPVPLPTAAFLFGSGLIGLIPLVCRSDPAADKRGSHHQKNFSSPFCLAGLFGLSCLFSGAGKPDKQNQPDRPGLSLLCHNSFLDPAIPYLVATARRPSGMELPLPPFEHLAREISIWKNVWQWAGFSERS